MINTEGLTLVGSGSEWFWSMLQFVIVAVTLIGIYVQVRQERDANAFEQANAMKQEWDGEFLTRRRLAMWTLLRDGGPDAEILTSATAVANFWEHVAGLVRAGHVSLRLVYQYLGAACQSTWNILETRVRVVQATEGAGVWRDFEWLAAQLGRLAAEQGEYDGAVTTESFPARADANIALLRQRLGDLEVMRTVVVAAPEAIAVEAVASARRTPRSR